MTSARFGLVFAIAATVTTGVVLWRDPFRMVDLWGHGRLVWWGVFGTLIAVTLTHLALLTIMLIRRGSWQTLEAALFDFIVMDGLFWFVTAWFMRDGASDAGIPLITFVLAALMLVAVVRFHTRAIAYYLLSRGQTEAEWDGTERRWWTRRAVDRGEVSL